MVTTSLYVRLEAKPGKEEEVANFLSDALPAIQAEIDTTAWFAVRFGASTFAIFDAFPSDEARRAHLTGQVARSLLSKAPDLFAADPVIESGSVLGAKLPIAEPPKELPPQPGTEEKIPMQVGSELHIHNDGAISLGNPEIEVGLYQVAADAVLSYRFDPKTGEHYLRLLDPVADRSYLRKRRPKK